ncbi:SMI1/KNR4 family protein [Priestia aryabhattai]|uniref:SMI1/KNR4 family protein n=1 Tax=Priestia aryabhattai TaxID=412384 RepID=UPI001C8E03C4|nr:SMI1/KNR4 family protein [Priestia aryabhattai]MBX9998571.1 SMI1/KNR4 family protein [Priestia aryabhattai]
MSVFHSLHHERHKFFPLKVKEIEAAEQRLGTEFPAELRQFYVEIGYGLANRDVTTAFQRIIDLKSAVGLRLLEDFYEHDLDLDMYDKREGFIFFEVVEGLYFEVRWGTPDASPVYFMDTCISDSLQGFFEQLDKDAHFYEKLVEE